MSANNGIIINGGSISATNITIGENVKICTSTSSRENELEDYLLKLQLLCKEDTIHKQVVSVCDAISKERQKEIPNFSVINTMLELLGSAIPAISGASGIVRKIQEIISQL